MLGIVAVVVLGTFCLPQGFRVVPVEECWFRSLAPLMAEVRSQMGDGPVYLSFDIDALDPGFAPGTGTPEIAGLTPIQVPGGPESRLLEF